MTDKRSELVEALAAANPRRTEVLQTRVTARELQAIDAVVEYARESGAPNLTRSDLLREAVVSLIRGFGEEATRTAGAAPR